MSGWRPLLASALACAWGSPGAAVEIVSVDRFVLAEVRDEQTGSVSDHERQDGAALGSFQTDVAALSEICSSSEGCAQATAQQNSLVATPDWIAVGESRVRELAPGHAGVGTSRFEIVFAVDAPTPWYADGSVENSGPGAVTGILLREEGGASILEVADPNPFDLVGTSFAEQGVLAPGTYRLLASGDSECNLEMNCGPLLDSFSRYRLFFFVPEPASGGLLALGIAARSRRRAGRIRRIG